MLGLDTNVLVRYLTQDDAGQSARATRLLASCTPQMPGFIPVVVLVELVWVLESCYQASHEVVARTLEQLLRTRELQTEQTEIVWKALRLFNAGHQDFADCVIACSASKAGCTALYSFDRAAIQQCGMQPVPE